MLGLSVTEKDNATTFAGNRVLAALRPDARDFLLARGDIRPILAGDTVFDDGAPLTHIVFPLEGVISYVTDIASGRNVEKASLGREGALGLAVVLGGSKALGRSVVQVPGRALWIAVAEFELALHRFEGMRAAMYGYVSAFIEQLMEQAACNSRHTAEQRVSRWLLQAHDRMPGDEFHITQEAVSQLLALRRATVNAVCTDLMDAGAIAYNRGRLIVRNRHVLHGRSCCCYDRMRRAIEA